LTKRSSPFVPSKNWRLLKPMASSWVDQKGAMSNKISNLIWLLLSGLFAALFVSCAAPAVDATMSPLTNAQTQLSEGAEELIKPGDTIGEMVVTEAGAWNWDTNLYSRCEEHGEKVEDRPMGSENVSSSLKCCSSSTRLSGLQATADINRQLIGSGGYLLTAVTNTRKRTPAVAIQLPADPEPDCTR
jgi:hypothetical protein